MEECFNLLIELSFLWGAHKGASANVLADCETEIIVIEGYFLNGLFNLDISFAHRFFRYLCVLLVHRIHERRKHIDIKQLENTESSSVEASSVLSSPSASYQNQFLLDQSI